MNKDITPYLPLYLGCECKMQGQDDANRAYLLTGVSYDSTQRIWWAYFEETEEMYAVSQDVFPILRPLSDMTEDELIKALRIRFSDKVASQIFVGIKKVTDVKATTKYGTGIPYISWDSNNYSTSGVFSINELSPEQFAYLLSIGIDLFGLIEAGLAIDKTKQP
jgi:hypothetical protein